VDRKEPSRTKQGFIFQSYLSLVETIMTSSPRGFHGGGQDGSSSLTNSGARSEEVILIENSMVVDQAPEGEATLLNSIVNQANTIVGAGMLSFPAAFAASGYVPGTLFLLSFGALSVVSQMMLGRLARRFGRPSSFKKLCHASGLGWLAVSADVSVLLVSLGGGTGYLIIAGDSLSTVVRDSVTRSMSPSQASIGAVAVALGESRSFWILAGTACVAPLSCMEKMDALSATSGLAMACVLFIAALVLCAAIGLVPACPTNDDDGDGHRSSSSSADKCPGERTMATLDLDTVKAFSVFIFGYNCNQNCFTTQHNELKDATPLRANSVAAIAVGGATAVYLTVSISGYASFGSGVNANVVQAFSSQGSNPLVECARVGIAVVVLLSYPLLMHAARASALNLIAAAARRLRRWTKRSRRAASARTAEAAAVVVEKREKNRNNLSRSEHDVGGGSSGGNSVGSSKDSGKGGAVMMTVMAPFHRGSGGGNVYGIVDGSGSGGSGGGSGTLDNLDDTRSFKNNAMAMSHETATEATLPRANNPTTSFGHYNNHERHQEPHGQQLCGRQRGETPSSLAAAAGVVANSASSSGQSIPTTTTTNNNNTTVTVGGYGFADGGINDTEREAESEGSGGGVLSDGYPRHNHEGGHRDCEANVEVDDGSDVDAENLEEDNADDGIDDDNAAFSAMLEENFRPVVLCVVAVTSALALSFTDLDVVLGLAGATGATMLSFIIPGLCYLRVFQPTASASAAASQSWYWAVVFPAGSLSTKSRCYSSSNGNSNIGSASSNNRGIGNGSGSSGSGSSRSDVVMLLLARLLLALGLVIGPSAVIIILLQSAGFV